MQEVRKSQNQDVTADLARSINSRKMESQTRRLSWLQAPEGSSKLLWLKMVRDSLLYPSGVETSIGRTAPC